MKLFFYLSGLLCGYSYFLYPVLLKLMPVRNTREAQQFREGSQPTVSLVITAHNEAAQIRDKIENALEISYPEGRLEIIIASDCSTDATDSIVESFRDNGVRLVRADQRKGKEYAQLCAIRESQGEILVFSDVATCIPADALQILAAKFADPDIGAVSSEDRFISQDGAIAGEGAYVKYEMWLRRLESERAGLVGLSGSFFAARRVVCTEWDISSPSDFNTALNCARMGLVAVSSPDVLGIYRDVSDSGLEYRRKMRTVIRGMTAIARHPVVLNPFVLGRFAFQVWSHKIMRWAVPWFMLAFAALNLALFEEGLVYRLVLYAQLLFYGHAIAGWLFKPLRRFTLVRIIYFFVQTNLAIANASMAFLAGKRMTVWTPSRR